MTQTGSARPWPVILADVLAEWTLYVSAALIAAGLILPSVFKPELIGGKEFTVVEIVNGLYKARRETLATIILIFSVVFPLVKTVTAAVLFRMGRPVGPRVSGFVHFLGKWSMLDVFLAALLIGLTQIGTIMEVEPRRGLYFFAAGVILNHLATGWLAFAGRPGARGA